MERLPEMEKCGSFMCGKESRMLLKADFMELTRESTLFLAVVIGLMIAFFTAFHADVAWDLILLKADDTDDFTELKMLLTLDLMALSTDEMTDLIPF